MPLIDKDTEREWWTALQEGSHGAFGQLYNCHKRAVFHRVSGWTINRIAEELAGAMDPEHLPRSAAVRAGLKRAVHWQHTTHGTGQRLPWSPKHASRLHHNKP